jgi:hypothetical protein
MTAYLIGHNFTTKADGAKEREVFLLHIIKIHSFRKLFTGLASAAFMVW